MAGFVDEAGGKVAVRSALTSGEGSTAGFVDEAGGVVKDVTLVRVQARRRVVRLNKTKPDGSNLM
jgi:hypothetical protein